MSVMETTKSAGSAVKAKVLKSKDEAIAAIRAILPEIEKHAAKIDETGDVPPHLIRAIEEAGLFGIVSPRAYGGSALGWEAFVSVVFEIGTVCGSTAWTYGVLTGHNHMATRLPESIQAKMLGDPTAHISVVFRLTAPWDATPTEGGYIINGGQGRYCSGVDFAKYVGVNAVINDGPNKGQLAFFMVEAANLKKLNDWDVMGVRGSQSRSIILEDVFVPTDLCALAVDLAGPPVGPCGAEETFYNWPYFAIAPYGIVGSPLGCAQHVLNLAVEATKKRIAGYDDELLATLSAVYSRISHAAMDIEIAKELVLGAARIVDTRQFSELTPVELATLRRNLAGGVQMARHAANRLYESVGAHAIYRDNPIERVIRDVNAGASHYGFTDDLAAPNYGRALLGLKPARTAAFV